MNAEQIKDMHLLYNAVYDEELREQFDEYNNTVYDEDIVEVATEYFYSYGLNEDGIDILVEKVGLESFLEYVYELSEDLYVLTEARRARKRTGGESYAEVKAKIDAKEAAKKKVATAASEKREVERKEPKSRGAESEAKAEQPKSKKPERKSIADRISNAIKSGVERHNNATATAGRLAGETGKTLGKLAKGVGSVAGQFGSGAGTVGKASKKVLFGEEVEAWVNQLVEEGYDLSDYTWDEMVEIYGQNEYIDEGIGSLLLKGGKALLPKLKPALKNIGSIFKKGELPPVKAPMSANAQRSAQLRTKHNVGPERSDTSAKRQIIDRSRDNATRAQAQVDRGNASPSYSSTAKDAVDRYLKAGYSKYGAGPGSGGQGGSGARGGGNKAFNKAKELNPELTRNDYLKLFNNSYEYDMFDIILEYLVAEGYADTNESALVIMANMSEEWRDSIIG